MILWYFWRCVSLKSRVSPVRFWPCPREVELHRSAFFVSGLRFGGESNGPGPPVNRMAQKGFSHSGVSGHRPVRQSRERFPRLAIRLVRSLLYNVLHRRASKTQRTLDDKLIFPWIPSVCRRKSIVSFTVIIADQARDPKRTWSESRQGSNRFLSVLQFQDYLNDTNNECRGVCDDHGK